jgi:uncharacterized membrane protein (UPF0127 family)
MRAIARAMVLLLLAAAAHAQTPKEYQPTQLRDFPRGSLTIQRTDGRDVFRIWFADTPPRQEQGLMWIRQLPADYGMVFPLDPPRVMNMWMKNTFVPLDMLFYDDAGRITHIHNRAVPQSETIISSNGTVAGVVEILAGEAARRGIKVGDRISVVNSAN